MKTRFSNFALWFFLTLALAAAGFAQAVKPTDKTAAKVENFQLNSKLMARQMPYRVVFPKDYETAKDKRYPVVYLLHGLTGHFDNWTDKTKLAEYAAAYNFLIVTPEGENGWYTDSPTKTNERWESYIVQELMPEIDKNFRTLAVRDKRVIGGLSMGGFGALKFGVKYPDKFVLAGSFSGAVGASSYRKAEEIPAGFLRNAIVGTFGEPESETHKANDLFKIISEMPPEKISALPFLYVSCGTEDELGLLPLNRAFTDILVQRKIPHEYRQLPGKHNWVFWNAQVLEFLQVADTFVNVK